MMIKSLGKAILGVAAVSLWALAPGCGPSIGGYCNKICDCVGCSDPEKEDCVDNIEDAKKIADDEGCGDKFNDVLSCVNDELTCEDGHLDQDGCESESKELTECLSGSSETGGSGG